MSNDASSVRWLVDQSFDESHVRVRWQPSGRRIVGEVERGIESAWQRVCARPGVHLFDGAVCRLESFEVDDNVLSIGVSATSYRIVVGTNFEHPELLDTHGRDVMANPVGVSAGVISRDGLLILGRRNANVAYYPSRVHPFAGSLEVRESMNLFDDVRRELREEIGFEPADIESILCCGLVEDQLLRHPEAVFLVRSSQTAAEILRRIDPEEHREGVAIDLAKDEPPEDALTPVAHATVRAARRAVRRT
jgi:8-oxo-dGTP pyrophosphatase MutT (NUDIX family)